MLEVIANDAGLAVNDVRLEFCAVTEQPLLAPSQAVLLTSVVTHATFAPVIVKVNVAPGDMAGIPDSLTASLPPPLIPPIAYIRPFTAPVTAPDRGVGID